MTVRARAVVAAAGALHTPALMPRSGVDDASVGKNLMLHPVLVIWGMFDEEIRPWEGMLGATYSDQYLDMDGGLRRQVRARRDPAEHPADRSRPGAAAREHAELMQALRYTAGYGALLRDRDGGEVRDRPRRPAGRRATALSRLRRDVMRAGVRRRGADPRGGGRAARLLVALAAGSSYEPGAQRRPRQLRCATPDALRLGRRPGARSARSTSWARARMGGSPRGLGVRPGRRGLGHARACTWSTARRSRPASGVNPMVTIEALAHMNARALAAKLG